MIVFIQRCFIAYAKTALSHTALGHIHVLYLCLRICENSAESYSASAYVIGVCFRTAMSHELHCPKSNIVKRKVYLHGKKCLPSPREMFLKCKSPLWERNITLWWQKCFPSGFSFHAKNLFFRTSPILFLGKIFIGC